MRHERKVAVGIGCAFLGVGGTYFSDVGDNGLRRVTRQGVQFTVALSPEVFRLPPSATEGARADPPLLPLTAFSILAPTRPTHTSHLRRQERPFNPDVAVTCQRPDDFITGSPHAFYRADLCLLPSRDLPSDSAVGVRVARLTPRQTSLAGSALAY